MTIEERIRKELEACGMWSNGLETVMQETKDMHSDNMARRWAEDESEYPKPMIAVLLFSALSNALDWVKKNCLKRSIVPYWRRP